jgi:hypothetical protein
VHTKLDVYVFLTRTFAKKKVVKEMADMTIIGGTHDIKKNNNSKYFSVVSASAMTWFIRYIFIEIYSS